MCVYIYIYTHLFICLFIYTHIYTFYVAGRRTEIGEPGKRGVGSSRPSCIIIVIIITIIIIIIIIISIIVIMIIIIIIVIIRAFLAARAWLLAPALLLWLLAREPRVFQTIQESSSAR